MLEHANIRGVVPSYQENQRRQLKENTMTISSALTLAAYSINKMAILFFFSLIA
jgi:hypothetical protein